MGRGAGQYSAVLQHFLLCDLKKEESLLADIRKTVNPPYEIFIERIFAYSFDAEASKAPSDEGAVSEAD